MKYFIVSYMIKYKNGAFGFGNTKYSTKDNYVNKYLCERKVLDEEDSIEAISVIS